MEQAMPWLWEHAGWYVEYVWTCLDCPDGGKNPFDLEAAAIGHVQATGHTVTCERRTTHLIVGYAAARPVRGQLAR